MYKFFMIFSVISSLLMTPVYADSTQGIRLNDFPVLVQDSAREHFNQEKVTQVGLVKDKQGTQYQVSGDIDGVQTSMIFTVTGFVTSITQTFQQAKEIDCADVKLPPLNADEEYYFQVEGLIQTSPIVRCHPGQAE